MFFSLMVLKDALGSGGQPGTVGLSGRGER